VFFVLALLLTLTLALPAPAAAGDADLWATINICDTEAYPNVLGVRASMPGNRTRQKMWMRFRATYYDALGRGRRRPPTRSAGRPPVHDRTAVADIDTRRAGCRQVPVAAPHDRRGRAA
jgi:hypothetical protein